MIELIATAAISAAAGYGFRAFFARKANARLTAEADALRLFANRAEAEADRLQIEKQRANRLVSWKMLAIVRFGEIAKQETASANATVKRMAALARLPLTEEIEASNAKRALKAVV